MRTTNKKSSKYVNEMQEFKASNLSARWETKTKYVVYSYDWYPVYVFDSVSSVWYENEERYSPSTARQMSQARPEQETVKASHKELKHIIAA